MRIGARRRVPTILQQEAVECGAACLAMVLAHHGRWVPLEELRESCDVNRDGTKASNLVKSARRLGMVAKGLKRDMDGLAALAMPVVVFWNFNHFVVVEGFAADGVWVNDPNSGPRKMLRSEFSDGFTGVVLAFEPGPEFRRAGGRERLHRIVGRRLFEFRVPIVAAVLAGFFLIVPGIVAAGFGRIFVDGIIVGGNERWLEPLLVAMLVVGLLRGALQFTQLVTLLRTQVGMAMTLAARQMWQILHLPLTFFTQRYAGDIAYRFQLVDRFAAIVTVTLVPALIGILSIAGYGAILFILDPTLGSIVAAASLTAVGVLALSARGLENTNRRLVGAQAQVQSLTIQAVAMADEFRASGTEDLLVARWSAAQAKVVSAEQSAMLRSTLLTQFATLVVALGGATVLVVGGLRVMDGAVTIGILLAFQLMMGNFTAPVLALVGVGTQMQQLRGLSERLDDIARYDHGAIRMRGGTAMPSLNTGATDLVLQDVSFGYRQLEPPFIEGLTLHVPAGARVGLVGGSGSGKSTIGRLMVGLVEPTAGTVALGGTDITDWDTPQLRRTVAYVDQSVGLIEGTIKNAISVWDKTLSEERIVAAAQDASAHDFIMRRPGGYASLLTEGGGNLSGGERQRLALARALAIDPALLVLDEATSALDPVVELSIMDALRRRGCACVIIAHRLSTIRDCDLIVVLRNGCVIESGTHGELMDLNGEYRGLVEH